MLNAAGIPDTRICAGFDYDGWTQIKTVGYINDGRMRLPAGAYRPAPEGARCLRTRWRNLLAGLEPEYFVVLSRQQEMVESSFPPIPYRLWLPPFRAEVYIQQFPEEAGKEAVRASPGYKPNRR